MNHSLLCVAVTAFITFISQQTGTFPAPQAVDVKQWRTEALLTLVKESELKNRILSTYDDSVRPLGNESTTSRVEVDLTLKQILEINLREEFVKMIVYIRFYWFDARFTWNPESERNISQIRIFANRIWSPDIVIVNQAVLRNFFHYLPLDSLAIAKSDGTMYLSRPAVIKTTCPIDITYFPFDKQDCPVTMESWSHTADQVDIYPKRRFISTQAYRKHNEMKLVSKVARRWNFTSFSGNWSGVIYTLGLRRDPLYFVSSFILPCTVIESVTLLIFILPCESGEKISVGVSLILGLTVLQLVLQDLTPINSAVIPLMTLYFMKAMVTIIVNIAVTVVILSVHHRASHGHDLPHRMQWVIEKALARLVCYGDLESFKDLAGHRIKVNGSRQNKNRTLKKKSRGLVPMKDQLSSVSSLVYPRPVITVDSEIKYVGHWIDPPDYTEMAPIEASATNCRENPTNNSTAEAYKTEEELLKAAIFKHNYLAAVLDRFCFLVFLIITIALNLLLFYRIQQAP